MTKLDVLLTGKLEQGDIDKINEVIEGKSVKFTVVKDEEDKVRVLKKEYQTNAFNLEKESLDKAVTHFLTTYATQIKKYTKDGKLPAYYRISFENEYNDETYDEVISGISLYDNDKKHISIDEELEYEGYEDHANYVFAQIASEEYGLDVEILSDGYNYGTFYEVEYKF